MIVSLGESLIDLIHSPGSPNPEARVGGSPYNVAIALSRLGVDTGFICPLSTDDYGHQLAAGLAENGVKQCIQAFVDAPTAIAEVSTDESGHPSYRFHRKGTADRALIEAPPADALPEHTRAVHFGSLVLAQESDWGPWKEAIVRARNAGAFIAFDPNMRPALIDDEQRHKQRIEEAVELSDLIKASDEDLSILAPNFKPDDRIKAWHNPGRIIVMTEGARGAQIWTQAGEHVTHRDTGTGPIVDTVGAGDTFQAALLAWLWHQEAFRRELDVDDARQILAFAAQAARLNCLKSGCQPPRLDEIYDYI